MPSPPELDQQFMRRAIRLAMNGRGRVEPNPMVGCVIVKNGHVIGGGYHQQYGQPHAEPNALASCIESPAGATAYVTLEPCCHTDKKTPPCTPLLIEAGIARVVVGCTDPNPQVNGKGVTLKWAQTADNKIAGRYGRPLQITNQRSSQIVHALRARCQAIAVGISTVLNDDPRLTARDIPKDANAQTLRVVLDSSLRIPPEARLFAEEDAATPIRIYHRTGGLADRIRELAMAGINLRSLPLDGAGRLSLPHLLADLYEEQITHLLVEPGPTLAASFFRENQADRLWIFRASNRIEDPTAPTATTLPAHFVKSGELNLDGDTLTEYLNQESQVYFANVPSADFILSGT
jgi:diaminohydroxyphosphoribosylaminopyrimidine deaminase/5-amino-6-(5-phosphoribosylamino)uracil reductase